MADNKAPIVVGARQTNKANNDVTEVLFITPF